MSERPALPAAAKTYIAALGILTAGIAAITPLVHIVNGTAWSLVPSLVAVLTAAAWLIMRVQFRRQVMALDLFEAALAPAIVALPGWLVMALVVVAQVAANGARKNTPWKGAFNVFQWTAAAGIASIVYNSLGTGHGLSPRNVLALLVAMVTVAVVNLLAFANVIKLAEGTAFSELVVRLAPAIAFGAGVNIAFGLLFVSAFRYNAISELLFLVPLAALGLAYRGYAAAVADRTRLSRMLEASRELSAPVDPRDALPAFLEKVRATFAAEAVELVLLHGAARVVHSVTAVGHAAHTELDEAGSLSSILARSTGARRITRANADHRELLARAGRRSCIVADVEAEGARLGVLCVYDPSGPEGWEAGETAVLQTLATEAGAAIRKGELLAQILEEREKLSAIVDNASDGIMMLDASGTVLVWSPGFEHITGYAAAEMRGPRALDRLRARDERGAPVALQRWSGSDIPQTLDIDTASGRVVSLFCSYGRVEFADGRPALFIAIARDVTSRRELDRMKDDFVATVSHELRTPLTPIIGWAEMLLQYGDRIDPEQRTEALTSIKRKSEDLQRLILHLLEASKIENGAPGVFDEAVDTGAIARRVVEEARAANPTRTIDLDISAGHLAVWGDAVCIAQILTNLVSNALNYSPADAPVTVRARTGRDISLSVIDRGPGIPPEDRERIFERFQRLGDHMTRSTGGTGLGLYIARMLSSRLGGTLTVQSEVGSGSTFTLKVPAAAVARAV